jgi:hypothetical protein
MPEKDTQKGEEKPLLLCHDETSQMKRATLEIAPTRLREPPKDGQGMYR